MPPTMPSQPMQNGTLKSHPEKGLPYAALGQTGSVPPKQL
jgi:hypothetical protein